MMHEVFKRKSRQEESFWMKLCPQASVDSLIMLFLTTSNDTPQEQALCGNNLAVGAEPSTKISTCGFSSTLSLDRLTNGSV